MPELPEVETVVRTLRPRLVGRTFGAVRVLRDSAVGLMPAAAFAALLPGERVGAVDRRGKYILVRLQSGKCLVAHLRMTGQFAFRPAGTPPASHSRVTIALDGDEALHFIDQRTFGKLYLLPDDDPAPIAGLASLGLEPLDDAFSAEHFGCCLARTRRAIKTALLDQRIVAGIGNIYADEALFAAGIHPGQPARSLTPQRVGKLHAALQQVLRDGITNRGTTFAHFRNAEGESGGNQVHLAVYGRGGEACPKCAVPLERRVLSGRSAHFCANCQPRVG